MFLKTAILKILLRILFNVFNHPSISAIKEKISGSIFNFNTVTTEEFVKEIDRLDPKTSSKGVSISLLKENVDICTLKLTEIFNSCILKGNFSQ